MSLFHTADRRLEQFLYAHFISFARQTKNVQGYTVWSYNETQDLVRIVAEYNELVAKHGRKIAESI